MEPTTPSNPSPGRPLQVPRPPPTASVPRSETPVPEGDAGLTSLEHTRAVDRNLPPRAPTLVRQFTGDWPPVETTLSAEAGDVIQTRKLELPRWAWFAGTLIGFFAGLLLWRLYAEVLGVMVQLASLPGMVAYPCAIGMVVILAGLAILAYRLIREFLSLRPARGVQLRQARRRDVDSARKAREFLEGDYAVAFRQAWMAGGRDKFKKRLNVSDQLLVRIESTLSTFAEKRILDSPAWIDSFEATFLTDLDNIAKERRRHFAMRVGLKTAIAPNRFLDTCAVLYNNLQLFRDMCLIYNQRTHGFGTALVFGHIVFNTFVAGEAEEITEEMADGFNDTFVEGLGAGLGQKVAGMFTAKVAEGLANSLLTLRMGRRTMSWLRPLEISTSTLKRK